MDNSFGAMALSLYCASGLSVDYQASSIAGLLSDNRRCAGETVNEKSIESTASFVIQSLFDLKKLQFKDETVQFVASLIQPIWQISTLQKPSQMHTAF